MQTFAQFLAMLSVGTAIIVAAVFFAKENFALLLIVFLIFGTAFAVVMHRYNRRNESAEIPEQSTPAELEPAEIQTAPQGASTEGVIAVTTSPSNHPLAGHTGAFIGILGLILDLLTASALFYFLVGWYKLPGPGFAILGLNYPWEIAILFSALLYYWLSGIFSVCRERSSRWAWVDFIGTSVIALVLIGAALSFHPVVGVFYAKNGLPTVEYNTQNMVALIGFGVAVLAYFWRYHIQRAEVGLEGIQRREEAPVVARTVDDREEVVLPGGSTISFQGATIESLVFADSKMRVTTRPHVVAGTDHPRSA